MKAAQFSPLVILCLTLAARSFAAPTTLAPLLDGPPGVERTYLTTAEGRALKLFQFSPVELSTTPRPAVVWIHGGAWRGGTADGFFPHARYFATRGAVGFSIEYRLVTPEALGVADCVADCRAAIRYLRTHAAEFGIDPHRIAVGGDSAGGHLAAALSTLDDTDDGARPDAVLLFNPVLDLTEGEWVRFVVGGLSLNDKKAPRPATPDSIARAAALSPVFHVRAGQPPALLVHGLDDHVVPPSQAERFAAAAKAVGNRCDLSLLPGTSHAFIVPRYTAPEPVVVAAIRATDTFLISLGWLTGEPTLTNSEPPAWQTIAPKPHSLESPSPVNQVFQFMQSGVCDAWSDHQPSKSTSYLWIPENCKKVRGLLILCSNVPEHRLVGHEAIRRVCAANDLGIVWSTPSFMNFRKTADGKKMQDEIGTEVAFLQQQLDGLAATSGYGEIATVPWLPMGESGHLLMVDALVETHPDRCIAGVWLKNNHLPPKDRRTPALVIYGTAQEWSQDKSDIRTQWNNVGPAYTAVLTDRQAHPEWPLSYVIDGQSGHFDCSERLTAYLAHYIDAMAKARLSTDGSPALKPVNFAAGILADLPLPGHEGKPVVPATTPAALPWFIDETAAREAQAFAAINWKADTQLPVFLDEQGKVLPHDFNGIISLKSLPFEADGLTFTVRGALADTIPDGFLNAGEKLTKAPGAPSFEWLCGPIQPLGDGRFRVALDRTWLGGGATYVALRQAGSETIRGSVQPAGIDIRGALRNSTGQSQKITFPQLPDVHSGAAPITLAATADSRLPVSFFVVAGPAIVKENKLVLTTIPPRTHFPVTVTVAAWQWGRRTEPAFKMAEIVQQSFKITAP